MWTDASGGKADSDILFPVCLCMAVDRRFLFQDVPGNYEPGKYRTGKAC